MADKPEAKAAKAEKVTLGAAGETSDPAVHQLLAELATQESNEDKDAAKAIKAELAELGYE